jgi:hypothetical protein
MIATSTIAGALSIVTTPSASTDAAISFSTEFFAPGTSMRPLSGVPERTST